MALSREYDTLLIVHQLSQIMLRLARLFCGVLATRQGRGRRLVCESKSSGVLRFLGELLHSTARTVEI